MDAMISGRTGIAVILEGKALKSFDVDAPSVLVPRQETEMHFIFGDAQDIQIIENTNLDIVQQKLLLEYNCACALDLALVGLDAELPDEIRQEAVEGLEGLLSDAMVLEKLESVLYGKPLPSAADIFGALACCEQTAAAKVEKVFTKLLERQVLIQDVCFAWEVIPLSSFSDYQYQLEFYKTLVNAGIMRNLVLALGGNENIETFLFRVLNHPDLIVLQNYKDVLLNWIKPFKQIYIPSDHFLLKSDSNINNPFIQNQPVNEDFLQEPLIKGNLPEQSGQIVVRDKDNEGEKGHRYTGNLAIDFSLDAQPLAIDFPPDAQPEEKIILRHKAGVFQIIYKIVHNRSVAEDLCQEALMKALEKIRHNEIRESERLSGFICSVARNVAINHVRKMQQATSQKEIGNNEQIPDPQADQFEQLWRKERAEIVRQTIKELRVERDREVLTRYYIAEEDKEQICTDLGLTSQQFNSVIFRALKRYKELYMKRFDKV